MKPTFEHIWNSGYAQTFLRAAALMLCVQSFVYPAVGEAASAVLQGGDGVEAIFSHTNGAYRWVEYRDLADPRDWHIGGPGLGLETADGRRANLGELGFERLVRKDGLIQVETAVPGLRVDVRQEFSFCPDGRTLRIKTFIKSGGEPVQLKQVGLLEVQVEGQSFRLLGPEFVSSPVFGDRLFAGVEHPSARCTVKGDSFSLAQPLHVSVGREWLPLPGAVFGSASKKDFANFECEK